MPSWLLRAIKLPPKYMVPILLFCGAILFAPSRFVTFFGLDTLREQHRIWFGVAFLGSACSLITRLMISSYKLLEGKLLKRKEIATLHNLAVEERQLLRYFIAKHTKTRRINIDSGVAGGLSAKGIIFRSANVGSVALGIAFNISDVAFDYLKKHPELLDTPGDDSLPTAFN